MGKLAKALTENDMPYNTLSENDRALFKILDTYSKSL